MSLRHVLADLIAVQGTRKVLDLHTVNFGHACESLRCRPNGQWNVAVLLSELNQALGVPWTCFL